MKLFRDMGKNNKDKIKYSIRNQDFRNLRDKRISNKRAVYGLEEEQLAYQDYYLDKFKLD